MTSHAPIKARAGRLKATDDYLELVSALPIRPIKSAKEHAAAQSVLDRLIGRPGLTAGQRDYVAALARFVEDYERERRVSARPEQTPLDLLRHLMEENDMSTTDLGNVLGSRGLASEVLNGKRGLSKTLIRKLAAHFGVPGGLFLDPVAP